MFYKFLSMTDKLPSRLKPAFIAMFPWLITGIALVGVIVIMTPRSDVIGIGDETWLNGSAGGGSEQPHLLIEPPAQDSRTEGFEGNPAQDTGRAQPPVDSVSALNIDPPSDSTESDAIGSTATELASDASRQQRTTLGIESQPESPPPPASSSHKATASNVPDIEASNNSGDAADAATVAKKEPVPMATEIQAQDTSRNSGPWVINLASLSGKHDAERFMAKAKSRGIAADLNHVTVKEKEFWRVQVPGYSTADEAKAAAKLIKKKLGLDDVWVVKQ
jgi:cell division septation protein DedD